MIESKLIEFKEKNLSGYTLIEGFPGSGLIGTIAAKHLVVELNMKKYGYIDFAYFQPVLRVRDGKPVYPSRIFIDEKNKLVLLQSEQAIPTAHIDEFAELIYIWIKKKKFSKVISMEGMSGGGKQKKIFGVSSTKKGVSFLKKNGIEPISEGVSTGISPILLLKLMRSKVDSFLFLAEASHKVDYLAAAQLVDKLAKVLKVKIKSEQLRKLAKQAQEELTSYLDEIDAANTKADNDVSMSPYT